MKKYLILIIVNILILLLVGCKATIVVSTIELPKSPIQHTNGTWWGYNQTKLVRYKDTVYTYYMKNDNLVSGEPNQLNPTEAVLLRINNDLTFEKIDTLYSSRPIALSINSKGSLHACVFEPTSSEDNGSIGSLQLYTYEFDSSGDFTRSEETVVANDGSEETANVRFTMSIDKEDNIVVGYGKNYWEGEALNHTMTAMVKQNHSDLWQQLRLAEHLGEDNYYPYFIINAVDDIKALSVQDQCYPEMTQFDYPCFYQYVRYYSHGSYDKIVDYSDTDVASDRPQLMEHTGFHMATNGDTHMITRAWLGTGKDRYKGTFDYFIDNKSELTRQDTSYLSKNFNWLRFFEYNNQVYLLGITYDRVAIINPSDLSTTWLDVPKNMVAGSYIYTNNSRGGSDTEEYLDIYLVPGDKNNYDHNALYIKVDLKAFFN